MLDIIYRDRATGRLQKEKVYKAGAIRLLYGDRPLNKFFYSYILPCIAKIPLFSALYGYKQKHPSSAGKIAPFIKDFGIDEEEFLNPPSSFRSFNDFFVRKLKKEARPLAPGKDAAIIPADGRYYFFQNIGQCEGFIVKGKKFDLAELLGDQKLALEYAEGSMVMARLCPSDYHRFHLPCDCIPRETRLINGALYSVNPAAVRKNIKIFTQNKRTITRLDATPFGTVLYLEIGATNVGSIQETYTPGHPYHKGDEKGYFEFGGSALILLFSKDSIQIDADLLEATQDGVEMRCLLGQSLGRRMKAG